MLARPLIRFPLSTVLGGLALAGSASVTVVPGLAAQEIFFGVGSSLYATDAFCLDAHTAITDAHLGVSGDMFGVAVMYDNADWPWPKPPGTGTGARAIHAGHWVGPGVLLQQQAPQFYLARGHSVQAVAELYPLGVLPGLRDATTTLRRYVKPFVGVGVQVSGDGETATDRELPTFAVRGSTDALVAYGASLRVPLQGDRFALQVQLRGTSLFSGGSELESPTGDVIETESETVTWATWLVGFSIGF